MGAGCVPESYFAWIILSELTLDAGQSARIYTIMSANTNDETAVPETYDEEVM